MSFNISVGTVIFFDKDIVIMNNGANKNHNKCPKIYYNANMLIAS